MHSETPPIHIDIATTEASKHSMQYRAAALPLSNTSGCLFSRNALVAMVHFPWAILSEISLAE
jgi:hypothetical protein